MDTFSVHRSSGHRTETHAGLQHLRRCSASVSEVLITLQLCTLAPIGLERDRQRVWRDKSSTVCWESPPYSLYREQSGNTRYDF